PERQARAQCRRAPPAKGRQSGAGVFVACAWSCFKSQTPNAQSRNSFWLASDRRLGGLRICEDEANRLLGVDSFVQLTLQLLLALSRQSDFGRLPAGHIRKLAQLVLQIGAGDVIPESIFQREHV